MWATTAESAVTVATAETAARTAAEAAARAAGEAVVVVPVASTVTGAPPATGRTADAWDRQRDRHRNGCHRRRSGRRGRRNRD
ncbi:hypothetical protein AN933_20980, partial [Mycobacterium intracellulare subsp. chimaera]